MLRSLIRGVAVAALVAALGACAAPGGGVQGGGGDAGPDTGRAADSGAASGPAGGSAPASTTGAAVTETEAGYRLGEGDRIAIQVFDEPDLTMESRVGSSGTISYSYLGDIGVANKTTEQIESEIKTLLSNGYLRNPSVNVGIVEFRPFFINGEVRSPGSYPYQPGLTLDRAIALAGGLTDRASTRKMFVLKAGGPDEEVKAGMSTPIAPGDIVSIKEGFF